MTTRRLTRRSFMRNLGKGTLAIAVLGPAACSDSSSAPTPVDTSATPATAAPTAILPATTTTGATSDPPASTALPTTWERVVLGNVSAYILAVGDRAAIVDTGNPGSAGEIEAALGRIGLGWDAVDNVIATHLHNDHVGSFADVMSAASGAIGYAGAADLAAINSPRPLRAVGDGDEVGGFQIIETPGHTAGHIAVLDAVSKVLVAGDALNTTSGQVAGSDPRFTADQIAADASVMKLGLLDFDVLLVGHGEPVLSGAAAAVLAFADSI